MTSTTFFFVFIPLLAIILLAVNLIFAPHNPYQEKNSTFECGFHSFLGQNRTQFSISFFIFALLFLLFDLEILLVYPYVVSAYINGIYGLVIMLIFFLALTLGFAFELGKNALKIDSRQMVILNNNRKDSVALVKGYNIFMKIFDNRIIYRIFTIFILGYSIRFGYGYIYNSNINFFLDYNDLISIIYYWFMATFATLIEYFKPFESWPTIYRLFKSCFSFNRISKDYFILNSDSTEDLAKPKNKVGFAKDSDSDGSTKSTSKGKGRGLPTDSKDELPSKKPKLDKGKGKEIADSSDDVAAIIRDLEDKYARLHEAREAQKKTYMMCKFGEDSESLEEYLLYNDIVRQLKDEINSIKSNPKSADWKRLTHKAAWNGYSAGRAAVGTPVSTPKGSDFAHYDSSSSSSSSSSIEDTRPLSPPLNYNPLDFISDDDGGESSFKNDRGESSSKNDRVESSSKNDRGESSSKKN